MHCEGVHTARIGTSQSPPPNASSSPFLSPTAHKALQWGAVVFMALSALSVGYACFPSAPLSLRHILRIGGGFGIGAGVGGLMFLGLVKPLPATYKIANKFTGESSWQNAVSEALKNEQVWNGWIRFSQKDTSKICVPQHVTWDNKFASVEEGGTIFYYIPVRIEQRGPHHYITVKEADDPEDPEGTKMHFPTTEVHHPYPQVKKGLHKFLTAS